MFRLLFILPFLYCGAQAQTFKRFHFREGTRLDIPISSIDSLTYPNAQQMFVHLKNGTVLPYALTAIDSVTFFVYTPFNTSLTYGAVTDIEGNVYKTIQIGTQTWMAENLRVSKFRNNVVIQSITDSLQWAGVYDNNTQIAVWCHYLNDPSFQPIYGKLYNWHAVVSSNGICPQGWHVPSDPEWSALTDFLGGESVAAGTMKSTGTVYWKNPNLDATNSSGFSALPGGLRYYYSDFDFLGDFGTWWTATSDNTARSWARYISYELGNIFRTSSIKENAFSVRCVKD